METKEVKQTSDKARMKMETAIWNLGAKKRDLTKVIALLKRTDLKDTPEVMTCIEVLSNERKRLDTISAF